MGQAASMCRFRGCRYKKHKANKQSNNNSPMSTGLHLRSIGEPANQTQIQNRMTAEQGDTGNGSEQSLLGSRTGVPLQLQTSNPLTTKSYDAEYARMEAWMDENQEFVQDYFIRKATRQIVDAWLVSHATSTGNDLTNNSSPTLANGQNCSSRGGSGATTPVRKISAHEFERGGLLKPIVNTIDGTPTFLSLGTQNDCSITNNNSTSNSTIGGVNNLTSHNLHHNYNSLYHNQQSSGSHSNSHHHHNYHRPQRLSRNELKHLDEKELIFELVKDICNELEVRTLCHKILQNVSILLNADRGSLFLVQGRCNGTEGPKKCLVSKLFDVCPRSTVEEMEQQEEVRVAWGSGIAGHVAESGEPVNIPDAYQDERFNCEIDTLTGYRTKALLCMPIKDASGDVIGVAQVINKLNGECFTENDEKVFAAYLQFCGIGLRNAQLYGTSQLEIKRNQVLLDLARMIFEEQSTIEHMVYRILTHMQSLIQCQRVQILLVHEATKSSFSRVFDFEANDLRNAEAIARISPFESRFPINIGITGHVATTGETVNIPNAYDDDRFDASVDENTNFKHKSILCMAIKNSLGQIIGVIQLINKFDDLVFTKNDENFVEAFAIFCGMGIHNTHMYEKAIVAMAKQSVTLEVLSYHASATIDDAHRLRRLRVPSAAHFRLHDFKFDDIHFEDDDTLKACLRMFLDLDFVERFHIDYEVLCRWLLSVKKNYRNVTYHNWRHAFNVAQMMFAILTATQWWKIFGEIECLALIIGCLCHDLDHRGTNNSFQIKASSPLAQLYSTSTMEHHHFDQCLMIINSPGNQILSNLSSEDYYRVIRVLEDAILSTDLAVYFRKRGPFLQSVQVQPVSYWVDEEPRALLRAMSMTVCDLSAITKPWEIEKRVADLVSSEFFEQGDMEKQELNITPIDIMNREKEDELPMMQVNFIETICLPIYEAFAHLSNKLDPLVEGVRSNREHWIELAEQVQKKNIHQQFAIEAAKENESNTFNGTSESKSSASAHATSTNENCYNMESCSVIGKLRGKKVLSQNIRELNEPSNDVDDKITIGIDSDSGESDMDGCPSNNCGSSTSSCLSTPPPTGEEDSSSNSPGKNLHLASAAITAEAAKLVLENLKNHHQCTLMETIETRQEYSYCKTCETFLKPQQHIRKTSSLKCANEQNCAFKNSVNRRPNQEHSKSTPSVANCGTVTQYSASQHIVHHGHYYNNQHHHLLHHQHHHHHYQNQPQFQHNQQNNSGSGLREVASNITGALECDKIPRIVGKLSNLDNMQFSSATPNGLGFTPNGVNFNYLSGNLLMRRHSENLGAALSMAQQNSTVTPMAIPAVISLISPTTPTLLSTPTTSTETTENTNHNF